jgi:hypothetical protein
MVLGVEFCDGAGAEVAPGGGGTTVGEVGPRPAPDCRTGSIIRSVGVAAAIVGVDVVKTTESASGIVEPEIETVPFELLEAMTRI